MSWAANLPAGLPAVARTGRYMLNFFNRNSLAKTFVATNLAQAVLDKKVSWKDDIRKYMHGSYPDLQYNGIPGTL